MAQVIQKAAGFLQSFIAYPPSQNPASFSIDDIAENVKAKIQMNQQQKQSGLKKK